MWETNTDFRTPGFQLAYYTEDLSLVAVPVCPCLSATLSEALQTYNISLLFNFEKPPFLKKKKKKKQKK